MGSDALINVHDKNNLIFQPFCTVHGRQRYPFLLHFSSGFDLCRQFFPVCVNIGKPLLNGMVVFCAFLNLVKDFHQIIGIHLPELGVLRQIIFIADASSYILNGCVGLHFFHEQQIHLHFIYFFIQPAFAKGLLFQFLKIHHGFPQHFSGNITFRAIHHL